MSKQSVSKPGKVVQFPGTQPFTYKGREICISVAIWPGATGMKEYDLDEKRDLCWFRISATNFDQVKNLSSQLADELGVCLEGG